MAEDIRKKYMKKYADVFKEKLERGDKIKCQLVRIETTKDSRIKPVNCRTPVPVLAHYRKSADKQIRDFLRAGIIKRCNHHTPWLSRGLFIGKKKEKDSQEVKVRLLADFSPVNRVLKSPNYPNKGSDAHLKQINPEARVFC